MAPATYVRGSFLGGEWSKWAQGRYDLPNYPTALNVCLNSLPVETGQHVRRPGTRFVTETHVGQPGKLLSFSFKEKLPYTIELTDSIMRLIASTNSTIGLTLVSTNDEQSIVSISTADPTKVKTAGAHGWTTGDHVIFPFAAPPLLQNREFVITVTSTTEFTMKDQITDDGDVGDVGPIPAGAVVCRVLILGSPYGGPGSDTDFNLVRKVQAETTALLLHPAVAPVLLAVTTPPAAATPGPFGPFAQFGLGAATFTDGPYLDRIPGSTITPTGVSGSITLTTGGTGFDGFVAGDVGRMIRLFSQPAAYNGATAYVAGNVVGRYQDPSNSPQTASYFVATANTTGNTPEISPTVWSLVTGAKYAAWAWGTITAVTSSSIVTVTISGLPLLYNGVVMNAWRLGAYGGANGYPTCGVYHTGSGRLWLGGAIDNRFDACVSNGIVDNAVNFAPTAADGSVGAANAITGVINAEDVNPILWMASHQQGILAGTQAGEWLIFAPSAGSIAPNNIDVSPLTNIGGLNTEARHTEHTLVFIHKFGRKIVEYFADVFSGKYSAPSITWLSKHLTKGGIQEIAYQQELVPTVWARVADALVGWVYKRDSLTSAQPPTIAAGHRHVLGSGRSVESISTGPSSGGTTDSLMMITNDAATNTRYVEVLTDMVDEGATLLDAQYVDCAIAPSWVPASPADGFPYGGMAFGGLWPLNKKTVTAWICGLDCGDYLITNGAITVPFGDGLSAGTAGGLLTLDYVFSLTTAPIWFGFTYTSQGQIVRPNSPQETGARNGPGFMKLRKTNWFGFQVEGAVTDSINYGTDFSALKPMTFKQPNGDPYTALQQFTGIFRDVVDDNDSFDSMICWEITRPYPANIVAVGGALETKDI